MNHQKEWKPKEKRASIHLLNKYLMKTYYIGIKHSIPENIPGLSIHLS